MKRFFIVVLWTITFNSFSQQPIFATVFDGDLYSYNLANCSKQFIGSTGQSFEDIAFTTDGKLWGIVAGQLYSIDTITANVTQIGNTGIGAVSLVGLNDSTLLAEYDMKLYGINTNNASSYYIDTIGYKAAGDLTWYDDHLYMLSPLVKIDLNSTNSAILRVSPINLTLPTCNGAVTSKFDNENNSIVGFNGPNLLKICQIDGSFQTLCPNLDIGRVFGAASIRLATQLPQPTFCSGTLIQDISAYSNFEIFPNPTTNELNIQTKQYKKCNFQIYNSFGQLVMQGILDSDLTKIPIDHLVVGFYSIEFTVDYKNERRSFIVER